LDDLEPETLTPILIIGCGNEFAGDDAAGVEITRRATERYGDCYEIRPKPRAAIELLEILAGRDRAIVIDAVATGAPPGTVHVVSLDAKSLVPRSLGGVSSHGFGLAEVLQFAERLGRPMPRIALIGIEIHSARPGTAMSPAVADAVEFVIEDFEAFVARALSV
jgi:hydrogenase maturation protease